MDALRKAEQQKQKNSAQGPQGSTIGTGAEVPASPLSSLSLEPLPMQTRQEVSAPELEALPTSPLVATEQPTTLPELPSSLEALDEQFMAHAAQSKPAPKPAPPPRPVVTPPPPQPISEPPPPPPLNNKPELARESARNVFEAKLPQPRSNRTFAIAVGLVSLVAVIGIGAYFWWQLQPKTSMVANLHTPPPSAPVAVPAPSPAPAIVATTPPAVQPMAVPPAPTLSSPIAPAQIEKDEDEEELASPPQKRTTKVASTKSNLMVPPAPQPESPFRKTTTIEKTDPLLVQAHSAYSRGESELARQAWQKVLVGDPRNLDALRGLAVVAQQNQQLGEAVNYYQRALDVDPKDAIALTGLMAIKVPTDMVQAESRLKTMLAEQPDSAYLNFALGNQFARQQRWAEAQQAYFKAYTTEPTNAGYVFNLAVSLDQLHQAKLAARYYSEALATAERQPGQPAGFDRIEVVNRLSQLQTITSP